MYYTDFYPLGPGVKGTTVPMLTEARVGEILDELDLAVEDSVLSRDEKARILIPLNLELFSNYDAAIAAATTFGLSSSALVAAKNAWVALRDGLIPAWNDTGFNTDIDRSLFRVAINNFIAAIAQMNSILTAEAARRADVDGGLTDGGLPINREDVITSEGISLSTMNLGVGPLIRDVSEIFGDLDSIDNRIDSARDTLQDAIDGKISVTEFDFLESEVINGRGSFGSLAGRFTDINNGLNGKASVTQFNTIESRVNDILRAGANLLFNPTGGDGLRGWTQSGTGGWSTDADSRGTFIARTFPNAVGLTASLFSRTIPNIFAGVTLTLSGDAQLIGRTAGTVFVQVDYLNSGGTIVAGGSFARAITNGTAPITALTSIAPAGSVSARVQIVLGAVNGDASAFLAVNKLKLETGAVVTPFSDEATFNVSTDGLFARHATLSTAVTDLNLNKAEASRVTLIEANQNGKGWLHPNANFTQYPATTFPNFWAGADQTGIAANSTRVTGENGTYAWRVSAPASTPVYSGGISEVGTFRQGQWIVAEAEFTLVSGTLPSSGIYIRGYTADVVGTEFASVLSFSTGKDSTGVAPGAGVPGRRYRFSFPPVKVTGATTSRAIIYAMTQWDGFSGPMSGVVLEWHKCGVRPATDTEIQLKESLGGNPTLAAKFNEVITAQTNGDSALATRTTTLEGRAAGSNLLTKAQWAGTESSYAPWTYEESAVNFTPAVRAAGTYGIPGEGSIQISQGGRNTTDPFAKLAQFYMSVPVEAGKRYCFSTYSGVISCAAIVILYYTDAAGAYISENPATFNTANSAEKTGSSPSNINTLKRIYALHTAPSNAVNAIIIMRKYDTIGTVGESYAFFSRHMFGEVPLSATEPPAWAPGVMESRLTIQESASADLYGRTRARWALGAAVPGATAFIEALAETTPGATPTSSVAIGATQFAVYNPSTLGYKKALEVVNGNVVLTGGLQAGAFIRLGNGNGWPVALRAVDFNVGDGEVVSFGTDLGALPNLTFSQNGLAPLTAGETYNLYAEDLTATGFTMRAKINIPATPTNQSLTGTSTAVNIGGYNGRKQIRGALADSADGTYTINASGSVSTTVFGSGGGFATADNEIYMDVQLSVYALKGGTWTLVATKFTYAMVDPDDYPTGPQSAMAFWDLNEAVTVGTGATEIAVVATSSGTVVNSLKVYWQSLGSGSGVRSATPSGQKVKVTVRPQ